MRQKGIVEKPLLISYVEAALNAAVRKPLWMTSIDRLCVFVLFGSDGQQTISKNMAGPRERLFVPTARYAPNSRGRSIEAINDSGIIDKFVFFILVPRYLFEP